MPAKEPVTPPEPPTPHHGAPIAEEAAAQRSADPTREESYEPLDDRDRWADEPSEAPLDELPPRPRRRLLGTGRDARIRLALLAALLLACGFIGGVLVEKGQTSSSSPSSSSAGTASGLASRFRALREGTSSAGTGASSTGGFTPPTSGTVSYLSGDTLYVTNSEGNTVKVTTSAGTSVTKTVKSAVKAIHPGETVTVTGTTGAGGAVTAESISVGSSGGGLAALFGRSGSSSGSGGGSSGGGQALFGG